MSRFVSHQILLLKILQRSFSWSPCIEEGGVKPEFLVVVVCHNAIFFFWPQGAAVVRLLLVWACHSFSKKWRRKQEEEDHPFSLFLFFQSSRLGSTHASANKVLDSPIEHSITCIPTFDFLQLKPLTFVLEGCWQT